MTTSIKSSEINEEFAIATARLGTVALAAIHDPQHAESLSLGSLRAEQAELTERADRRENADDEVPGTSTDQDDYVEGEDEQGNYEEGLEHEESWLGEELEEDAEGGDGDYDEYHGESDIDGEYVDRNDLEDLLEETADKSDTPTTKVPLDNVIQKLADEEGVFPQDADIEDIIKELEADVSDGDLKDDALDISDTEGPDHLSELSALRPGEVAAGDSSLTPRGSQGSRRPKVPGQESSKGSRRSTLSGQEGPKSSRRPTLTDHEGSQGGRRNTLPGHEGNDGSKRISLGSKSSSLNGKGVLICTDRSRQAIKTNSEGSEKALHDNKGRLRNITDAKRKSPKSKVKSDCSKPSRQRDDGDKKTAERTADDELGAALQDGVGMEVTISLTFIFASIVGELYFILLNNRRFMSGRWSESYIAMSLALNIGLALLLESLISALPSISSTSDVIAACTWLSLLYSAMRLYHEHQAIDCLLKAISRFPLIFLMLISMVLLKSMAGSTARGEDDEEDEEDEDESVSGSASARTESTLMAQ